MGRYMEATAVTTAPEAAMLDEEFRALELALEDKRRDDARHISPAMVGEDVTLHLADGRVVRGFLDRCEDGAVRLAEGGTYPLDAIREIVQHPKTLWA